MTCCPWLLIVYAAATENTICIRLVCILCYSLADFHCWIWVQLKSLLNRKQNYQLSVKSMTLLLGEENTEDISAGRACELSYTISSNEVINYKQDCFLTVTKQIFALHSWPWKRPWSFSHDVTLLLLAMRTADEGKELIFNLESPSTQSSKCMLCVVCGCWTTSSCCQVAKVVDWK